MPSTGAISFQTAEARVNLASEFEGLLKVEEVAANDAEYFPDYHERQYGRLPRRVCEHKNCFLDTDGHLQVRQLNEIPESDGRGMWVSTDGGTGTGYIAFDFGKLCSIGAINVWNGRDDHEFLVRNVRSFTLEASTDGTSYETIANVAGVPVCPAPKRRAMYYGIHYCDQSSQPCKAYELAEKILVDWLPFEAKVVRFTNMKSLHAGLSLSSVHFLEAIQKKVLTLHCALRGNTEIVISCTSLAGETVTRVNVPLTDASRTSLLDIINSIATELSVASAQLQLLHPDGTLLSNFTPAGLQATLSDVLGAEVFAEFLAGRLVFTDANGSGSGFFSSLNF